MKLPSAKQYAEAIQQLEQHLTRKRILLAQYDFPHRAATARQLAAVLGFKGFRAANLTYGSAGRNVAEHLKIKPPYYWSEEAPNWWSILSEGDSSQEEFLWIMRPEVAEALRLLGWVNDSPDSMNLPTELDEKEQYYEGARLQVTVNIYERSAEARRLCLDHYGYKCAVCGLAFPEKYGTLGEGFIEVHHLTPLAEIGEEYVVNPICDLCPICPNCHAMIHRRNPPLSVEELQQIMRQNNTA